MVGVILVNYHTEQAIRDIALKYASFNVIDYIVIVNNEATVDSIQYLNCLENKKISVIHNNKNVGYSIGNNIGIKYLINKKNCEFLIISNSDILIEESVIKKTLLVLKRNVKIGAAAPRMLDCENKPVPLRFIQLGYLRLMLKNFFSDYAIDKYTEQFLHQNHNLIKQQYLHGSFFAVSKTAIEACNYFDEGIFLYREEEILGMRLKMAGYKEVVLNNCYFIHNHTNEDAKKKVCALKTAMKSELYYFKNYKHTKGIRLFYVKAMQFSCFWIRYIRWKFLELLKSL